MDQSIRDYISLLDRYASLQRVLSKSAAESFISLSRCRYNNIKLFTEKFRTEFDAFITVEHETVLKRKNHFNGDEKSETTTVEKEKDASQQEIVHGKEEMNSRLTADTSSIDCIAANEKGLEHGEESGNDVQWVISIDTDKRKNPMRDIERLPSQSLRATQASFKDTIDRWIALANVYVELQQAEDAIRELRREESKEEEVLPLSELSINERSQESSSMPSTVSVTETSDVKSAETIENERTKQ